MTVRVKKLRRQNSSISYDDRRIDSVRREQVFRVGVSDFQRLDNGKVVLDSKLLNRRLMQLLAASRRLIRLGPYSDDFVRIVEQATQRRHRGVRCAHED